ncbi:MAG: hypothetical protein PHN49_02170 [Candidatus Omnitrophica bacterium]|nr:hypothetical protein [Candidatus Omnitrophota bacterium]MDD5670425.1 hypothetical protein [Candidatus Omnitrophota bacterium]
MIDEFQSLESLPAPDPFGLLGREIMVEKETLYLVTSSKPEKAQEIFHDKLSLLFGNFEVIELATLGYEETAEFMQKKQPGFSFSEIQKKFMLKMTDGFPAYLDLLLEQLGICFPVSHAALNGATEKGKIEVPTERLLVAFQKEIYDHRGRLALIFEKRVQDCRRFAKDSASYVYALLAICSGKRKLNAIASHIERKTRETKKILDRLAQEELITKCGAFYIIKDFLFRFWLQEVFYRKNQLHAPHSVMAAEGFSAALQKNYENVGTEIKSEVSDKAEALFKDFRNDLVEIDGRKWRCPQFSEVIMRKSHERLITLLARAARFKWVCKIATEPVQEEDILLFQEDVKRFRKRVQRKVFIILAGIEQNAKLLAQESKILLWDLHSFNTLLDLYNLPKIVIVKEPHGSNLGTVEEVVHSA